MSWIKRIDKIESAEIQSSGAYSRVPKFVHDDCNAVSMVLGEDAPEKPANPLRITRMRVAR